MCLHSLDGLGISGHPLAVAAAGALLHYLKETQRSALAHLDRPTYTQQADWMILDPVTMRHLELFDSLYQQVDTTLLYTLDRTAKSRVLGCSALALAAQPRFGKIEQRPKQGGPLRRHIFRSELHRTEGSCTTRAPKWPCNARSANPRAVQPRHLAEANPAVAPRSPRNSRTQGRRAAAHGHAEGTRRTDLRNYRRAAWPRSRWQLGCRGFETVGRMARYSARWQTFIAGLELPNESATESIVKGKV